MAKQILNNKIKEQTTEGLIEQVKLLSTDLRKEASLVFELTLSELETRLPEQEYIELCESL